MLAGRQIWFMIDQHFKISEMESPVYEAEHLFSIKLQGDRLQDLVTTWDQVLSGLGEAPNEQTLRALPLGNLRRCKAMEQDLAYRDRLPPGHEEKSYDYLLRCSRSP